MSSSKNFKYLDELIHSGVKEIVLDSDIVLDNGEESEYKDGIKLDVNDIVIDGKGHAIDACGKTSIFKTSGENVIIKDIVFKNGDYPNGGAIFNTGELTVISSTFTKNTAKWGGAINNRRKLSIIDSTLSDNAAEDDGGAIFNYGEITLKKSSFTRNTAGKKGGVLFTFSRKGIAITDSTLADNSTEGSGGAIYTASPVNIKKSSLTGNGAKHDGGAIFNDEGTLTIEESSLTGNTAQQNGGALYYKWGEINLIDSILSKNIAKGEGSAVWLQYSTKYKSNNCTFKDNTSKDIYVKNESVKNYKYLDDVIHSGEHEIALDCDIILDEDEKSQYEHGIKLDVDNLVIDGGGHFINAKGASIFHVTGANIVLKNFIFKGAYSSYGAAIRNTGKLHIHDCIFEHNFANYAGGGIENSGELTISGSLFNKNSTYHAKYSGGGAIVNNSKLSISDSSFTDNSCEIIGAIYNCGELSVEGCSFDSNRRGAIFNQNTSRIENSTFTNHSGTAIINEDGNLTVVGCNFESNSEDGGGAAIGNYGMTIISDSSFKDNHSKYGGGAIDNSGQLFIHGSHFKSNKSDSNGGAICLGAYHDEHELTIMESSFESNEAKCGGAIWDENIWIRNSIFKNNLSETGGSTIDGNEGVNICGCDFESNIAKKGGCIIGADMYESEIKNCTFKDNKPSDVYKD